MNPAAARLLRVPLTVAAIWAALAVTVPILMARYAPYVMRPGFACVRNPVPGPDPDLGAGGCASVSDLYGIPFGSLFIDAMFRSLALLVGAAVLALVLGTLLGMARCSVGACSPAARSLASRRCSLRFRRSSSPTSCRSR